MSPSIDKTTSHHSTTTLNDKDKDKAAIAIDDSGTERGSKSNVVVSFSLKKKQVSSTATYHRLMNYTVATTVHTYVDHDAVTTTLMSNHSE